MNNVVRVIRRSDYGQKTYFYSSAFQFAIGIQRGVLDSAPNRSKNVPIEIAMLFEYGTSFQAYSPVTFEAACEALRANCPRILHHIETTPEASKKLKKWRMDAAQQLEEASAGSLS